MQKHAWQVQKQEKELEKARYTLDSHFKENFLSLPDSTEKQKLLPSLDEPLRWEELCKIIYVEAESQPFPLLREGAGRIFLRDKMNEFLQASNKWIAVILGNPGSGKTTFSKHWLGECFSLYREDPTNQPLPVFIPLNLILNETDVKSTQLLEGYFRQRGLTPNQIDLIKGRQPLVVVCDGFDEVSYEGNLYQANKWESWSKAKFIITTRPEKFGSALNGSGLQDALVKAFSPSKLEQEKGAIPTHLILQELCDFNENNIRSFVIQWHKLVKSELNEEQYLTSLKGIPGLYELTSNPIILSLVLYTLPDIVKAYPPSDVREQKRLQRVKVYDYFVKQWFATQASRVLQKEEMNESLKSLLHKEKIEIASLLRAYSTQLGYWCLQNNQDGKLKIEIPIQETLKPYLLLDECREIISEKMPHEQEQIVTQLLTALRSGCLLKCDSRYFRFFHKSLVEYFAQEHIFKGVVGRLAFEENGYDSYLMCFDIQDLQREEQLSQRIEHALPAKNANIYMITSSDELYYIYVKNGKVERDKEKIIVKQNSQLNLKEIIEQLGGKPAQKEYQLVPLEKVRIITLNTSHTQENCGQLNTEILEPNLLRMLAERVKENKDFCVYLYEVVRESKKTLDVTRASANAITILNYAKEPLNRESWQGIRIAHADLSGANLHHVDFREADLSYVNFSRTNLEDANLDGSNLAGCQWGVPERIQFESDVTAVVYPYGDMGLVVGDDSGKIYFIDPQTWSIEKTVTQYYFFSKGSDIIGLTVDGGKHKGSQLLASGSSNGIICFWELPSGKYSRQLKQEGLRCLALNSSGQILALGSEDKNIYLLQMNKRERVAIALEGHIGEVLSVAWSPDSKLLASGGMDKTVRLWDGSTYQQLITLQGHTDAVNCVAWSPDGMLLVSGSRNETLRLWGRSIDSTYQQLATFQGFRIYVRCAVWSVDGKLLILGSGKTVRLWDEPTRQQLATLEEHARDVDCVAWSPDGKLLVSGSWKTVHLWDGSTYQQLATLGGYTNPVYSVAWSADGGLLASGSWRTVHLWDRSAAHPQLVTLPGHTSIVTCVAWSVDGKLLASGSGDNTVRLWNGLTHQYLVTLSGHTRTVSSIAWSADRKLLASGSWDNTVRLWDSSTNRQQLPTLQGHTDVVNCVAWSADGKLLASGSWDNTVRLWDSSTNRQQLPTLQGHTDVVNCVAWRPDGKLLASGSSDETVRLWNMESFNRLQIIFIGCLVRDIKFLDEKLLIAASQANLIHYFVYQRNKHGLYTLWERTIENSVRNHLNLEKTRGLTGKQYRFLTNQGAEGNPACFTYTGTPPEELRVEEKYLEELQEIKKNLQYHRASHTQVASLFDSSLTISFLHSWAMYLYRITQPKMNGPSGRSSIGNRHAYGLIEGLDQLGRRLLVRIDLVEDASHTQFARVKVKNVIIESVEEREGQGGFFRLCQSERQPEVEVEQIVCFRAGTLDLKELDTLFQKVIEDMQRQLYPKAERLIYRFRGGDDQRDDAHNCLTWLRHLVKDFKRIYIPRGTFDFFATDPQAILPTSSGFNFFSKTELSKGLLLLDIENWRQVARDNQFRAV